MFTPILLVLATLLPSILGLKFDMQAHGGHESKDKERCIRNFVQKNQLVVVMAIVSGSRGDGQMLNIHIHDTLGNQFGKPRDVFGENRYAFTAHDDAAFDVCFENILTTSKLLSSAPLLTKH